MKIYVDYRERDKIDKFKKFVASGKCELIKEVEVGSYQVSDVHDGNGIVGIERKHTDFVKDMWSKKLDQQMRELKQNFQCPVLLLEYDGLQDFITSNIGVGAKKLFGELTSIIVDYRIPILFVGDYYVPACIRLIEKHYSGKNRSKITEYTPIRRKPTVMEVKRAMFANVVPGFGTKKVNALFEHFDNSILNICKATEEELREVKGVGPKLAKEIYEVLK